MDALKPHYLSSLRGHLAALEAARAGASEGTIEACAGVRRIAHQLRGSGTTFGFPDVTDAAAAVEDAVRQDLGAAIIELIETIDEVLDQATEPIPILLVEDDPDLIVMLEEILGGPDRRIDVARSLHAARQLVGGNIYALAVIDLRLPDGIGQDLVTDLRQRSRTADMAIVVASAIDSAATRAECFALGADAYFVKPFDPDEINAAVSHLIARAQSLQRATRIDPLTLLPNRVALVEEFARLSALAVRTNTPLSLAVVDLDHFKHVNDTHGHDAGDAVLQNTALRLQERLRRSDLVARWGGEEFVLLLNGTHVAAAAEVLTGIQADLAAEDFRVPSGATVRVGFSAGVTAVRPGASLEEAFHLADLSMYDAKRAGRGRVHAAGSREPAAPLVLVVEDDPMMASLLQQHLRTQGLRVAHASTLESARVLLRDAQPAAALLDVDLPDGTGMELLSELRRSGPFIPVMMVTSEAEASQLATALDAGADDYLRKPFEPEELIARVRKLLRGR